MTAFHSWQKRPVVSFVALFIGLSGLWTPQGYAAEKQKKGVSVPAAVQDNMTVEFEYTLTVDGAVVDSSQGRSPLKYVHGKGEIVPGLEKELTGLHIGDSREVTVQPQDAYGQIDPTAFMEVPKTNLPKEPPPKVGMVLTGKDPNGHPFQARIAEIKAESVRLDMNHPLAGKTLNFKVKVLSISPPAPAER